MSWLEQNANQIFWLSIGIGPFVGMAVWVLWEFFKEMRSSAEDTLQQEVRLICQGMERAVREERRRRWRDE